VKLEESTDRTKQHVKVQVEDRVNCCHFAMRLICGVQVARSPGWLQHALSGVGLRPVNNIVDVTNYVMMETGQPLHAFDLGMLRGGAVIVRQKTEEGVFTTLDGKTVTVPQGAVMVCDAERDVSIAGVMGGANSHVGEGTRDIAVESASWNPSSIRRTAKFLGLSTEASYRFERGVDPQGVIYALNRAAQLMREVAGGNILKGIAEGGSKRFAERIVSLRTNRTNQLLGTSFSSADVKRLLEPLDIRPSRIKATGHAYRIPSFRVDVETEIDLIEEVARTFGYDRIEERSSSAVPLPQIPSPKETTDTLRRILLGLGFQEVVTNPMLDFREVQMGGGDPVKVLNPGSAEMNALRTSLIPGVLSVVARNLRHRNENLRLFEIGNVFRRESSTRPKLVEDFLEEKRVAMVVTGLAEPQHWSRERRGVDLFDLKGEVESLLKALGLDKSRFISYSTSNSLVEEGVGVETNDGTVGYFGKVRADLLNFYGIECLVFVSELDTELCVGRSDPKYSPLPKFPRVRRDVAFVVDQSVSSKEIGTTMLNASSGLLQRAELFDLYEGDRLPAGKKSLAFSLELSSTDRTLTDEEIESEVRGVVKSVETQLGGTLRSFKEPMKQQTKP